jgi:hypothetical protein
MTLTLMAALRQVRKARAKSLGDWGNPHSIAAHARRNRWISCFAHALDHTWKPGHVEYLRTVGCPCLRLLNKAIRKEHYILRTTFAGS